MIAADLHRLQTRLEELAAYYGKPVPPAPALRIWLDVLAGASIDDVLFVLTDWPKTNRAPPLADQVLKLANDRRSDRLEEQSRKNARAPGFEPNAIPARSEVAATELAKIKSILQTPKPGPKQWAHKLRKREEDGEPLTPIQQSAWRAAMRFYAPSAEDYEAAQERLAIKAEA